MAKSHMVQPKQVQVTVSTPGTPEDKPKRRTSHGIVCGCGSEDVSITNTIDLSKKYPGFMAVNSKRVRRYCVCNECDAKFTAESVITEKRIK